MKKILLTIFIIVCSLDLTAKEINYNKIEFTSSDGTKYHSENGYKDLEQVHSRFMFNDYIFTNSKGKFVSHDKGRNWEEISVLEIKENSFSVNVFPNPTNGNLEIKLADYDEHLNYHYKLMDYDGSIIREGNLKNQSSAIDLSNVIKGRYYIILDDGNQNNTTKMIILK